MEVLQRMAKINGSKLPPGTLRVETEVGFVRNVRVQGEGEISFPACSSGKLELRCTSPTFIFTSPCTQIFPLATLLITVVTDNNLISYSFYVI